VANVIPTYLMSLFLIPKSFCLEITAIMRKFWWGFPQDKKHSLSFLSWDTICQPKALGGLGIRPLEFLNHSLLARLGWKLTIYDTAHWVDVLKSKYLKDNVHFLESSYSPTSSWLLKGLIKNREVVKKGTCISISNGDHVDVWSSPWIPLMPDFKPRPNVNLTDIPGFCVADLIIPGARVWNILLLQDLFDPFTVECIPSIHLPFSRNFDKWFWAPASSGIFSVKFAFTVACSILGWVSSFFAEVWHKLWDLRLQARLKHLLWKIAWNMLPTRANIGGFVIFTIDGAWNCPFCKGPLETLSHIFLECNLAIFLWNSSPWSNCYAGFSNRPISDWVLAILFPCEKLAIPKHDARRF